MALTLPLMAYAKDLEYYVTHFGFTNAEAIHSATRLGGLAISRWFS